MAAKLDKDGLPETYLVDESLSVTVYVPKRSSQYTFPELESFIEPRGRYEEKLSPERSNPYLYAEENGERIGELFGPEISIGSMRDILTESA